MKKVVLAYSGGLDTSVILKWLQEKGHEVYAYIADVGQKDDFSYAEKKAKALGAKEVFLEDLKKEFVEDYIFPAMQGGAVYEGRYLLGTSLARPIIAKRQIEIAKKLGAEAVAHGATGKGNDQVRFELAYLSLMPNAEIIAPWKDAEFLEKFKGRVDLLNYANEKGIEVGASNKPPYSMDANLMHISYESGILEDPARAPEEDMFEMTVSPEKAPEKGVFLSLHFEKGVPVLLENNNEKTTIKGSLDIFNNLNTLAGAHGVGRIDIVENRFVGIKSRGVYETPAGTVLWKAFEDLELISIDREVYRLKQSLMPKFAELIYNGYWFSPEMEFILNAHKHSTKDVSGRVDLELYKGNVIIRGRKSESTLYSEELASMDVEGGYSQEDAQGFIRVNAVRLRQQ